MRWCHHPEVLSWWVVSSCLLVCYSARGVNWKHLMKRWCKRGWIFSPALLEALLARLHSPPRLIWRVYQNKNPFDADTLRGTNLAFFFLSPSLRSFHVFSIPLMFILTKDQFNGFSQTSQPHLAPFSSRQPSQYVIHHVGKSAVGQAASQHQGVNSFERRGL